MTTRELVASWPDAATEDGRRLHALLESSFGMVWRTLRRLGVPAASVEDAAQQAWMTLAQNLSRAEPGKERSFLFGIVLRVAADHRRRAARSREVPPSDLEPEDTSNVPADELVEQRETREMLDQALSCLAPHLRAVFVMYEIEELSSAEIAATLDVPTGTVASRLRRARELFTAEVTRMRARRARKGTP